MSFDKEQLKQAKNLVSEIIGSFMGKHTGEAMDLLANIKNLYLEIPEDLLDIINLLKHKSREVSLLYGDRSPDLKKIRDLLTEIVVLASHLWTKIRIEVK